MLIRIIILQHDYQLIITSFFANNQPFFNTAGYPTISSVYLSSLTNYRNSKPASITIQWAW